jgi:tRNA(adenine34) deaminase
MDIDQTKATNTHIAYMQQCIALAKKSMAKGNFPVGSIVVKNDVIIGKGLEDVKPTHDVTKHAEIEAIKDALNTIGSDNLENCELYTTHEPCLMCSYAIRHYKIKTVIYGTKVNHVGGITSDLKVMLTTKVPNWKQPPIIIENILEEECKNLSKNNKI